MRQIKILGMGCAKCKKLTHEVEFALTQTDVEAEVVKVEDLDGILAYGVAVTPALVIDEVVVASGRIPAVSEIVGWLRATPARAA